MSRAASRAASVGTVLLAALLLVMLTPSVAHAWTPGTHIFLGEAVMR